MVIVVNSIPQRPVNSQLVCLQPAVPVGICIKFLFIYIRVALETAGTAGLAFSLYYRVTFLSRMYYTTGVSEDIRHILFLFNSIAKQPVPSIYQTYRSSRQMLTFYTPFKRIYGSSMS